MKYKGKEVEKMAVLALMQGLHPLPESAAGAPETPPFKKIRQSSVSFDKPHFAAKKMPGHSQSEEVLQIHPNHEE